MVNKENAPRGVGEAQERGKITLEIVAYNLYGCNILDWEMAFGMSDWELTLFKKIGNVRVKIIRDFRTELNDHRKKYTDIQEHVVTESPKGNLKTSQSIVVDGMEVPFISSEVEYMIKEMLDGSPMSKDEYVEHMKRRKFEEPKETLERNVDFLNKYFHLGLKLQEEEIDGVSKYSFMKPETTKVRFGENPTK